MLLSAQWLSRQTDGPALCHCCLTLTAHMDLLCLPCGLLCALPHTHCPTLTACMDLPYLPCGLLCAIAAPHSLPHTRCSHGPPLPPLQQAPSPGLSDYSRRAAAPIKAASAQVPTWHTSSQAACWRDLTAQAAAKQAQGAAMTSMAGWH